MEAMIVCENYHAAIHDVGGSDGPTGSGHSETLALEGVYRPDDP